MEWLYLGQYGGMRKMGWLYLGQDRDMSIWASCI
jgi:hypothetical protein